MLRHRPRRLPNITPTLDLRLKNDILCLQEGVVYKKCGTDQPQV